MGAFQFHFDSDVSLNDAERTLHLAAFAVEGLVGPARVLMGLRYTRDERGNIIDVEHCDHVSQMIVQVYAGLLLRELGDHGFRVHHIDHKQQQPQEVAA